MRVGTKAGLGAVAAAMAWSGQALASGFELREQSAVGQGVSFAGAAARSDDTSFIFFNPAAMAWMGGNQIALVGSGIFPTVEASSAYASRNAALGGSQITGSLGGEIGIDAFVPAGYATFTLTDAVRLGVGVTSPWGLETKSDSQFVGRYHALTSELRTINITPALSYRPLPNLAFGFGLQIQAASTRLTSAADYGSIGAAAGLGRFGLRPGAQDGSTEVEGNSTAYGWQIGALWEPLPGTRLGFGFRSAVFHDIEGTAEFQGVPALLRPAFGDTTARAKLATPETATLGLSQQIGQDWTLLASAAWTNWSRFHQLVVEFDNGRAPSVTQEKWEDSWFFSVGAEYRWSPALTLRAGVAYDQSPVQGAERTPRIPDNDRYWLSFGASYQVMPNITLSAAYSHLFVDNATVNLRDPGPGNSNLFRGNLSATYKGSVDIVSAQIRFTF